MKSRLTLTGVGAAAVLAAVAFVGPAGWGRPPRPRRQRRRPPSAHQPPAIPPRPRRSLSGVPRPGARSSRPAPAASSVRRTSATSSRAMPRSTWASSTSPCTTQRWRSKGATSRTRRRRQPRPARRPRPRSRPRRTTRSPVSSHSWAPARRSSSRLRGVHGGDPRRHGEERTGSRSAHRSPQRCSRARERRPGRTTTVADLGQPRPAPASGSPGTGAGARPAAARGAAARRYGAPRSSGPAAPAALTQPGVRPGRQRDQRRGRVDSTRRTTAQTNQARFWTDHDLRQWNDGLLRLAAAHGLDLVQTARMLAMAHMAGGDAIIACFDAKYHYWFWRPYQAIPQADTDGNPATVADPTWPPLGTTPNHPEYPSAHACHSTAVVTALHAFFGTDKVTLSLDSRAPGLEARASAPTTASATRSRTSTRHGCSSASTSATPT